MTLRPRNKQWTQPNDGDSRGEIFASWGIDLETNKGSLKVSKPLKNVFDHTDDGDLDNPAGQFIEYGTNLWAVSNELFKVATTAGTDITLTANWAQDAISGSPDPGANVTDAVYFDGLLLVQDGTEIKAYNGTAWSNWWTGTLGQSALTTGETFILKVAADGNLYIVDNGNKVYRVSPAGSPATPTVSGAGTLDFSATPHVFKCATTTSSRIFFGSEDTSEENAIIVEWDMGSQSLTANRIHEMGVKRILCLATWNDTPIAILSDGSIKYHNGSAFVDWQNAHLPISKNQYQDDIIHKNGWAIIDDLPHFLINPTVDINDDALAEDTSNYWYYPAGIYCLDPEVGLYCRYTLADGAGQHFTVSRVGALHAYTHFNTKFFASYEVRDSNTTTLNLIAAEDTNNASSNTAWLIPTPAESFREIVKQVTLVHKKLESGDSINVYYSRSNPVANRVEGSWFTEKTFNTTDSIGSIAVGDMGFIKAGANNYQMSRITEIDDSGAVNSITFEDSFGATLNDTSVMELVTMKKMGSADSIQEIQELTIPEAKQSRQVWLLIELTQAAGNDVQLDYFDV